jgi:hypothetical protein
MRVEQNTRRSLEMITFTVCCVIQEQEVERMQVESEDKQEAICSEENCYTSTYFPLVLSALKNGTGCV